MTEQIPIVIIGGELQQLPSGDTVAGPLVIDTRAALAAATMPASADFVRTSGYTTVGDGGAALYKRVGSSPAHNLKVQSVDTAWWELVPTNNVITAQATGMIEGDSAANGAANVTAFNDFIGYAQTYFTVGATADGPTLQFPKGDYHFNAHLNVKAAVRIVGAGSSGEGVHTASVLHWPVDKNGIIIQDATTIDETIEASSFSGSGTYIEGLWLEGGGFPATLGHGIWMRSQAHIVDCVVQNFGLDGFHIVANFGSGGATEGNANGWSVRRCIAKRVGTNGLFVSDADANVGFAEQFQAQLCGRWGIWDDSLLGNTYTACNMATNGMQDMANNATGESSFVTFGGNRYSANVAASEADLVATTPGTDQTVWILTGTGGTGTFVPLWVAAQPSGTYFHGGPYRTSDVNARNTFLGCYRETDQGSNQLQKPAIAIGGLMDVNKGSATSMRSSTIHTTFQGNITFTNDGTFWDTATETLELEINRFEDRLMRVFTDDGWMTLAAYSPAENVWPLGEFNNNTGRVPMYITSDTSASTFDAGRTTTPPDGGNIFFPRGVFIGDQRFNARHITNGTVAPTTGNHARGEIVFNRNLAANGILGWICTVTGTPGTWVDIGNVTQAELVDLVTLTGTQTLSNKTLTLPTMDGAVFGDPAGDIISPAYTFTGESSLGMYQDGTGKLAFGAGIKVFDINSSGFFLAGGTARVNGVLDEDNMVSDSAVKLATQQSIKAYADTKAGLADVNTFTATQIISNNGPILALMEQDQAADWKRWHIVMFGSSLSFAPVNDIGTSQAGSLTITRNTAGVKDLQLSGGTGYSTTPPSTASVINRERGDLRYTLASAGVTLTGTETLTNKTLTAPDITDPTISDPVISGFIRTPFSGTLTIAAGVITVTGSYHDVDTEAAAATDDLDTISGGLDGAHLYLRAKDSTHDVVLKDNTGNLRLAGDFTMTHVRDQIHLMYQSALSSWVEQTRSDNQA